MKQLLLIVLLSLILFSQDNSFNPEDYRNREVVAIRLTSSLIIDGILDESLYNTPSNNTYIQFEPINGIPASEDTEFWIGYDNDALYFGAYMYDSMPDSIFANLCRRDGHSNSDFITLELDTYHDKRTGFWFGINPTGSISDGTISNDSEFSIDWDGIWEGVSRINNDGWSVEMRIPFSQLRFNKSDENIMGIGLVRKIHRKDELDVFHFSRKDDSGAASHYATLRGIQNIQPPKRLELSPYITGNHGILKTEEDNPFYNGHDTNLNIGTDLKIGIGNNLTIDATINPDFGQVEVDPAVINLSAFETVYQEKRPFFIEGADIFSFGNGGATNKLKFGADEPSFFYSRRIGRYPQGEPDGNWVKTPSATSIIAATKISGKITDSWSIGAFSGITKQEFAKIQLNGNIFELEIEPFTSYNLLRSLKEFNNGRQGLGAIATFVKRNFDDKSLMEILSDNSMVLGVDGWTFLNSKKDWVVSGWLGYSGVNGTKEYIFDLQQSSARYFQRPDADHVKLDKNKEFLNGFAGKVVINKETGNWNFNSLIQFVSPGFENNDMGLNYSADKINKHVSFGYDWYEPGDIFLTLSLNASYASTHNFAGNKVKEHIIFFGHGKLKNYWSISPIVSYNFRTLSDNALRGGPLVVSPSGIWSRISIRSDSRKSTIFGFDGNYQESENNSYSVRFSPNVNINIGTRLRLIFDVNIQNENRPYQYIDSFDDETAVQMLGCRHIVGEMKRNTVSTEMRVDYTFTPKLSFQAYIQPYMTVASYSRFKEYTNPESYDFVEYGVTGGKDIEMYGNDGYLLYPNGKDENNLYLENPDFNYKALVGNAVLRWEFRPGSTLYLVWTRNGSDDKHPGNFEFIRDAKDMFKADADNVLAVKFTYWFGS